MRISGCGKKARLDQQSIERHLTGGGAADVQDWRAETERPVGSGDQSAEVIPPDDGEGSDHNSMPVIEDHFGGDKGDERVAGSR